eukprot:SAG11_NODE_7723_length_1104_cov_1.527363_2_plen_44_part_01
MLQAYRVHKESNAVFESRNRQAAGGGGGGGGGGGSAAAELADIK